MATNVLNRQFAATAPNQKWFADFTYIWAAEGWLYVAAVVGQSTIGYLSPMEFERIAAAN